MVLAPFPASCWSTIPGLERALHRDDASVRASWLSRDLRQPLREGGGSDGNPDDVAAKVRRKSVEPLAAVTPRSEPRRNT
jgi:hypothetical protein